MVSRGDLRAVLLWRMEDGRMTKQEAIKILDEVIPPPEHHTVDLDHLLIAQAWLCIKETLTAEPIRQARWKGAGMGDYMCSLCNEVVTGNRYHYCPNCGAKMHGGENG